MLSTEIFPFNARGTYDLGLLMGDGARDDALYVNALNVEAVPTMS